MQYEKKIKVLFLITDLGKGGAERYLIDLCYELINYPDIEFIIASLLSNNHYNDLTQEFRIEYMNFQPPKLSKKNGNESYKKLLEEFKPDIIHTHRFLAEFISSYYVNPKIVYICHGHDNMVQLTKLKLKDIFSKQKLLNALERNLLIRKKYRRAPNYFIVNSEDTLSFFENNLPSFLRKNMRYIPYGFNYERFYAGAKTFTKGKKIRILNVGSFQEKKNQRFLINIALELKNRNVEFEICMIGVGENYEVVRELISSHKLEHQVKLAGMIHNVEEWYRKTDLYIHTAYYEPFGLVLLEAMASGTPVISLDGKGNRDLIQNGVTGFLINEQNAAQFADRIEALTNDEKLYQLFSENGVLFSKGFDVKQRTKELIQFYKEVLCT
jgi:glycosyltransferase involved in cell wall biosynthesis